MAMQSFARRAPWEALIYWLRGRIAASRGARKLAYLHDMSRFLRAGLLALHPARRINQRFLRHHGREPMIVLVDFNEWPMGIGFCLKCPKNLHVTVDP